jgi:hypothetical protein
LTKFGQNPAPMDVQSAFIQLLKDRMPNHLSLVDELADALDLSTDSAYRRMRGETQLTLQEVEKLCSLYKISIDSVINTHEEIVPFEYQPIDENRFTFRNYLENVLGTLNIVDKANETEVLYLANDIPLFHLMHIPEIASFKLYFWEKTILNYTELTDVTFKLTDIHEDVNAISRKLRTLYCSFDSTEVYSSESIDATLKQIEYSWVSGHFQSPHDALFLCDKLVELLNHMKKMATLGYKFIYSSDGELPPEVKDETYRSNYEVYFNEVVHTDNTVLIRADDQYMTFLTNNGINSFHTKSKRFYTDTRKGVQILLSKATLISGTSEKQRNRIFNNFIAKVEKLKTKIGFEVD